ncbi:JmjC domain, hydroxylase-domain-containing protein, partial [Dimargaris cristalligena]
MRSVRTPYQERASPASSTPPPPPASTTPKDPPSHQTTSPLGSASASSPPPPTTPRNRHFGLPEAPVFYPTPEEFANPLQYIEKIRPLAEHAGLCKIIPPAQWAPTFALDTEVFRFHTRKQQLNSLEGKTRANLNYLEQLYKFHAQQGNPGMKVPQLAKKPIDLYSLKKEVDQRGGYLKVTAAKKWAEIGRVLNYHRASCTSLSNSLKKAYTNIVLPYELYLAKGVEETAEKDEDDDADEGADAQSDSCQICHSSEKGEQMLLCDGCDHGFHLYCLDPPLSKVPRTDWYCLQCILQAGGDFGFEDGGEYSLHAFQKKCNTFKKNWFASYFDSPAGAAVGDTTDELVEGKVPEQVVEAEFWRLVESPYEAVEVEYGADLHSMQHGSAFPTKERNPLDPYSLDPWNLNVIPILPQSLFSFIKSDISGMMNPWLYVGMCFSTFCWHNEDHYTYSINYMHWGDTKTWYGIPGAAADQFERAIQRAVPELFEQQPDLLFQLVTMLSPGTLRQSGVDVYALDQRPGQFVVTFPKSYHAGFNHGFNFAEAVNFATPDWVPFGLDSVRRYQEYQRLPVFSHDELLWTIASYTQSTEVAEWLHHHMTQLRDRELLDRAAVRQRGLVSSTVARSGKDEERPPALPAPDEENQCCHCKAFSYLSAVTCNCTTRISCLQHWEQLCDCPPSARHVELRYSDHQLCELTDKIVSLATVSKKWVRRFRQLMLS